MYKSAFYRLLSAERKRAKCESRIDFLKTCADQRIIPHGLQFNKYAALGKTSEHFREQWNLLLNSSSVHLLKLIIEESAIILRQCHKDIEEITNEIIDRFSLTVYLKIKKDVDISLLSFTSKLKEKHKEKLNKFKRQPWIKSRPRPTTDTQDWWDTQTDTPTPPAIPGPPVSQEVSSRRTTRSMTKNGQASLSQPLSEVRTRKRIVPDQASTTTSSDSTSSSQTLPLPFLAASSITLSDVTIEPTVLPAPIPSQTTSFTSSAVSTPSTTPEPGFIHKTLEPIKLRGDEFHNVINLSSYDISYHKLRVLAKGLNFTPLPPTVNRLSLKESIIDCERNLRLAEYFYDLDNTNYEPKLNKFRPKSSWTPPANRDKYLEVYISCITNEIMCAPEQKSFGNFEPEERSALKDLQSNPNIVIREADKGSAVVVMDRERYVKEGYRQLDDVNVYQRVDPDSLQQVTHMIRRLSDDLLKREVITKDMHQFANKDNCKPARFYLLPKVHKAGVPGRPVISACG